MNEKYFSEYRHHDYRTPRSIKEAYGWDAPIWEEEPKARGTVLLAVMTMGTVALALVQIVKRMVA